MGLTTDAFFDTIHIRKWFAESRRYKMAIKAVPTSADQFISREEKIAALMARDIMFVKYNLRKNDYAFLIEIMSGDYRTQYANLCDDSLDLEFNELKKRFHEHDLDLMNDERYVEVLTYLWHHYLDKDKDKYLDLDTESNDEYI